MWRRSFLLLSLAVLFGAGCDRGKSVAPTAQAKSPRVVSLVPTASDILEGIGAGDHLAAVSNWDTDPRTASLPRVGDYLTTDWERIAPLRPQIVVTQYAAGRTPAGFSQRLKELGATQLNITVDRLEDIYSTITQLADSVGEHEKGETGRARLRERIDAVRTRVANEPTVPAMIVLGPEGNSLAGPGTFYDELLSAAGGRNVAEGMPMYPNLDPEKLASLRPEVIIQILPAAGPQVVAKADQAWEKFPNLPAVKNGRVVRLTEWYVMHSGYEVGTLAERFAEILHPSSTTKPAPAPSGGGAPSR